MSERDRRRREIGRRTADGTLMARRVPDAAWNALRRRVIARDTYCCICGEVVDKSLRFPDPMSATVDHVIPVVDGGQHTLDNCRLAHYSCNSRRGSKSLDDVRVRPKSRNWLDE